MLKTTRNPLSPASQAISVAYVTASVFVLVSAIGRKLSSAAAIRIKDYDLSKYDDYHIVINHN